MGDEGLWKEVEGSGPWRILFAQLPQVEKALEALQPSQIVIEVDGIPVAWLERPPQIRGWLLVQLWRVCRHYPEPQKRLAMYAGDQPVVVLQNRQMIN